VLGDVRSDKFSSLAANTGGSAYFSFGGNGGSSEFNFGSSDFQ
jgi:hypothetical protein